MTTLYEETLSRLLPLLRLRREERLLQSTGRAFDAWMNRLGAECAPRDRPRPQEMHVLHHGLVIHSFSYDRVLSPEERDRLLDWMSEAAEEGK